MASPEHLELSNFIKCVHQGLRLSSQKVGASKAWSDHCQNSDMLKKYADAMKALATNHWTKSGKVDSGSCENRIDWVVSHCMRYFFFEDFREELNKEISLAEKHGILFGEQIWDQFKREFKNLRLLDVGSCYNPFKHIDRFQVTAIDLYPATEDVVKCDFLNAEIADAEKENEVLISNSYDVVVFSLLLEYLPSPEQRYLCCKKAYQLLKPLGLLFILTPDSKHATANSKLIKSWRICLASLGFNRIYYEKLKHLHCLVFKKTFIKDLPLRWFVLKNSDNFKAEDMLKIPQDSVQLSISDSKLGIESKVLSDFAEIADTFTELPHS